MKPFIAHDTHEPLVVLGGYEIAEDGSIIRESIKHAPNQTATDDDIKQLYEHGIAGLEDMELFGVLDRLKTSDLI